MGDGLLAIVDGLATGRMVRISAWWMRTRECLALEADTSLGSGHATRVLERLIAERGRPENVRSDNGPGEFTSRRMLAWSEDLEKSRPGSHPARPDWMQNGHVESFHGRLRVMRCASTTQAGSDAERCPVYSDTWREEYNCEAAAPQLAGLPHVPGVQTCPRRKAAHSLLANHNHQPKRESPVETW